MAGAKKGNNRKKGPSKRLGKSAKITEAQRAEREASLRRVLQGSRR